MNTLDFRSDKVSKSLVTGMGSLPRYHGVELGVD